MTKLYSASLILIVLALLGASSSAQVNPQNARIAYIDTGAFAREGGIPEYINASRALEKEFEPQKAEIGEMIRKYESLSDEVKKIQGQLESPPKVGCPINLLELLDKKVEEARNLDDRIRLKQEELMPVVAQRRKELIGPVLEKIKVMLTEFAALKGYAIIHDSTIRGSVVSQSTEDFNATADFLAFYKSRSAPFTKSQ